MWNPTAQDTYMSDEEIEEMEAWYMQQEEYQESLIDEDRGN